MKVYVAWIQENDYETTPYNIGVWDSFEKAQNGVLDELKELDSDAPLLSLEIYNSQDKPHYLYEIEEYNVE